MNITPSVLLPLAILAGVAPSAHAALVYSTDFTSGTYSDGPLDGQDGWAAALGGTVVSGTGVTFDGFESIVQSASSIDSTVVVGETYTSSVTFTYDDNSGGNGSGPHIGAAIYNGTDPGDDQLSMLLRRTGSSYRLTLSTDWGSSGGYGSFGFNQSATFADTTLGIDHDMSDPNSDVLTLSLALTAGADVDSWTVVGTVYNNTTMSQAFQYTLNDISFAAPAGSTIYGGWGGGQSDGNQNIANRTASAYSFSSTFPPVPEPSTSMIVLFVGLVLAYRR